MLLYRKLLHLLAGLSLIACSNKGGEPITPNAPVGIELNLQDTRYRALLSPTSMIIIDERPYELASIGFAGLAVVHGLAVNNYYAYDLSCPVENQRSIKVTIDGLELYCPVCGTYYDALGGSGAAIRGVGTNPLRRYPTIYTERGQRLTIKN